jgi:hypothetical protein
LRRITRTRRSRRRIGASARRDRAIRHVGGRLRVFGMRLSQWLRSRNRGAKEAEPRRPRKRRPLPPETLTRRFCVLREAVDSVASAASPLRQSDFHCSLRTTTNLALATKNPTI